jgi:hypothetical protein
MRLARRGALALLIGLASAACYKPNIQDGGLRCADGGACPEGFHCAGDGTCRKGGAMICQIDSPHVDPICAPQPGDDCDPICQSRCECGRCNLSGTTLACTPAGSKQTGATCSPSADDCAPGNICLADCDGKTARCYRFCASANGSDESVCGGQPCDVTVNDADGGVTSLTVCEPPAKMCNPVGDTVDCGNDALGCYITSTGGTLCDCKGTAMPGKPCSVYNSCIPGYRCISFGGPATAACYKTCTINGTDCAAPSSCTHAGSDPYGYCSS